MFPLGRGLMPGAALTLQVFEPRYLEMIDLCLRRKLDFGVVLIERGWEVGGGDDRFDVGVAAAITEAAPLAGGRLLVKARGGGRIRAERWLSDDPYPQALVRRLSDPPDFAAAAPLRERLEGEFRRALALLAELGADTGKAAPLPSGGLAAAYQALDLLPVSDIDRQKVLQADDPGERIELAAAAVASFNLMIEARLAGF